MLPNLESNQQKNVCNVVTIFAKYRQKNIGIILLQGQYKTKKREWKWIWNEEETFNKRWYIQYMGNKDLQLLYVCNPTFLFSFKHATTEYIFSLDDLKKVI